jgi:hypothetical protein
MLPAALCRQQQQRFRDARIRFRTRTFSSSRKHLKPPFTRLYYRKLHEAMPLIFVQKQKLLEGKPGQPETVQRLEDNDPARRL